MMDKREIAIFDFGSGAIRLLTGEKYKEGFKVNAKGVCDYSGFYKGEFFDKEKELTLCVKRLIKQVRRAGASRIKQAIIGVPDEFSMVKCGRVTVKFAAPRTITKEDVDGLYYYADCFGKIEGYKQLGYGSLYYVLDNRNRVTDAVGCVTGSITAEVFFTYMDDRFFDPIGNVFRNLGIVQQKYVCSALCQADYLVDGVQKTKGAVLVDVGFVSSSVNVALGEGTAFLYGFHSGGGSITSDLCREFGIDAECADELKNKADLNSVISNTDTYNFEFGSYNASQVNEVIKKRLNQIADNIIKGVNECPYPLSKNAPLYLTGGGVCYICGAREYIGSLIGKTVMQAESADSGFSYELSSAYALMNKAAKG
ncbi:MAG: hypothetical protein PHX51_01345 [Clostridia bacterium]|nr:hypothetical protein [Clostridia bacterium]